MRTVIRKIPPRDSQPSHIAYVTADSLYARRSRLYPFQHQFQQQHSLDALDELAEYDWKTKVVVFYGPTGTGRSYRAMQMARHPVYRKESSNMSFSLYRGVPSMEQYDHAIQVPYMASPHTANEYGQQVASVEQYDRGPEGTTIYHATLEQYAALAPYTPYTYRRHHRFRTTIAQRSTCCQIIHRASARVAIAIAAIAVVLISNDRVHHPLVICTKL